MSRPVTGRRKSPHRLSSVGIKPNRHSPSSTSGAGGLDLARAAIRGHARNACDRHVLATARVRQSLDRHIAARILEPNQLVKVVPTARARSRYTRASR